MNNYNLQTIIETSQYSYKLIEQLGQQIDGRNFKALKIEKNEIVVLITSNIINPHRLSLLKKFQLQQCENLVNIQDYSQKENELIIIMDWVEGSFQEFYQTQIQVQAKLNLLMQIAKGLSMLHKVKLIYQDLNPSNIAYIKQNGDYLLKLFIPGLPRLKNNPSIFDQYKAVEQIKTYNEKVDIWAFGMIFYEMISGNKMFQSFYSLITQNQIQERLNQLFFSDEIKIFLGEMLAIEYSQRLNSEKIVDRLGAISQKFQNQSQIQFIPFKPLDQSFFTFYQNSQSPLRIGQEQYQLQQKIHDTPNVQVYEAENTLTKEQVVIKKQNSQSDKELVVLQKIKEANLKHFIKIINFCQQQSDYFIVMEKAHGSLQDILKSGVQNILIKDRIEWFKQIVKGVIELHEQRIIHRDLKPANILFKKDQNGNYIFLLCDTDTTTLDNFAVKSKNIGTLSYKAPEIWSGNYNEKVDIWSLGLIFYELLVDENTLNKELKLKKLNSQLQYDYMQNAIDSLPIETGHKKLFKGILQKDVETRFSANDVLQVLEQDWKQLDNSQKNAQNNFYQIWNKLQDVQNLKQRVNGYQVFGIQQSQVQNSQQQQANEKIKAQKLEQERLEKLRQEELEKQRFEKQKEEIQRQIEKEKQEELNRLRQKDEEEQKKKLQLYQQQLEEQKKRDIEAEISKAVKALEEKNQKELAEKEKEIKEKMAKLEEQNKQLQLQDLQKYNNEKVQLELKKQNEIDKIKQEQLLKQQQEIQKKEFEIKQQKEQELQVKLGQWRQQVKKRVEDQVRDKYQKQYEEQARNLKLKQLEEQKQLLKNKKDTLKSQMICVKVFVGNQIEFMNSKKVEIQSDSDQQLQQVQLILQQIEQFLQLLQTQQEFIQNDLNQLDYFTQDQINTLQKEYETSLQLINEQNQQYSQIIADQYSKIKLQQIETEQQKRELIQQLMNLKTQLNQKLQQSGIISNENNSEILNWQKTIYDCHFASPEMKQQFEQIKETDQIAKAQLFQLNQFQYNRSNDVKELIQLTQNQIKQLENVFVQSNEIKQKLVYLSDYYRQQKQKYINDLQDQKLNLLNQCETYLEQAQAIYQYQSQLSFDSIKQFIQEIKQLEQLQKQIEQLLFLFDINDINLSFNEKQLKQYQMEVQKKNTQIKDCKNKFLVAYQEQKEAAIVQEKCKNAYNQLLGQINFQQTFEDYQNRLLNIQNQAAQLNNHELASLITQKFSNYQKEQQAVVILQSQLQTSLLGGTIKTEKQFQIVVNDFNNKINNIKNNREKEIIAIKELEFRVQQSLTLNKSQIEQEVNEISHSIESILTEKIVANKNNLKYLRNLNQLQQFDILKDGGFNKEIETLKAKVNIYEKRYEEVQEDIKILQKEQNQQIPSSFLDQQKKKMEYLAQISNQIFQYNRKLKCQLNSCETQQKNIKYYNNSEDIEKLQQKLINQIQQEEVQLNNFQQKLNQLNTLQNQSKNEQNINEILTQLKTLELQYKSSMISRQGNYFDEWQSQIERLIPVKQQFQLCRSYVLQSNLFDLERLCIRRFHQLSIKQQQQQENQQNSSANTNIEEKRKQDLMDIQKIQETIEDHKSFLNKQEQILSKSENFDLDLIQEYQNIQLQINEHQQTVENAIKQNNLVKLRSNIKNQDFVKKIQNDYMPHFEGSKMKVLEYLLSCIRECDNDQIQQII